MAAFGDQSESKLKTEIEFLRIYYSRRTNAQQMMRLDALTLRTPRTCTLTHKLPSTTAGGSDATLHLRTRRIRP